MANMAGYTGRNIMIVVDNSAVSIEAHPSKPSSFELSNIVSVAASHQAQGDVTGMGRTIQGPVPV